VTARLLVIEDGHEYVERFRRFLGHEFEFARAGCLAEARVCLADGCGGLLLDLDFRRTPPEELVDEQGNTRPDLPQDERKRLAESQGILLLRALRADGRREPALLFADVMDTEQVGILERSLAPLAVLGSDVSLPEIARRIRALAR
jgi:hypothetical protein